MLPVAVAIGLLQPAHFQFFVGFGVGAAATMVMVLGDSPPPYIENWRAGAEGEKATARAVSHLTRNGWTLTNDVDTGFGNIDHVLVGPAGIFVIESKKLRGEIRVDHGLLSVRWPEDPADGYRNARVVRKVKAQAADLSRRLQATGPSGSWVQPLVVVWGRFRQRSVLSDHVAWVSGEALADVLAQRPTRHSDEAVSRITSAVRAAYT